MSKETYYHEKTPLAVREILELARRSRIRLKIYLGDADTGRDWMEESDKFCYVGRSAGEKPIPLAIASSRSCGGGAILDHCIVRIVQNGRDLYRHPKYHQSKMEIYNAAGIKDYPIVKDLPWEMKLDGKLHARFKNERSAKLLFAKLS